MPWRTASSPAAGFTPDARAWASVVALSLVALVVQGTTLLSLGVLLPQLARDFGGQAGSAATAMLLAMSLANLPVGWLMGRIDGRLVLAGGVLLTAAGWAGMAVAQDRIALVAAAAMAGTGVAAASIVPGIALITRDMGEQRGLALALFLGATIIGGAVVPPLAGVAVVAEGWRTAMLAGAGAVAAAGTLILLVRPGPAAGGESRPTDAAGAARSAVLPICMAMVLLQLAINGVLFAAVDCLTQAGLSQTGAIAAYSLANLAGLPALLTGGFVIDRIGPRRSMIGICLLLALGSAPLPMAGGTGWPGVALFVVVWGVASALPGQAGSMLLADAVPAAAFSRLLGLVTAISGLIGALAPWATDLLRGAGGSYAVPMLLYTALALAAAPFIALVPTGSKH
jgi:MFS family permease